MTDSKRVKVFEHTLAEPIENADGERIEKVILRRPKGRQLREAARIQREHPAEDASFMIIAALAGITMADVDEMDPDDITALSDAVEIFFPTPPTGGN